jgi:hypothetical protein
MTAPGDDDAFEPLADGASAAPSPSNEGSNVCRAAALAYLLRGITPAIAGLTTELRAIGFSDLILHDNGRDWAGQDLLRGLVASTVGLDTNLDLTRMSRWAEMNENADAASAVGFLVAMLGSVLERESAAAAAALWRGLNLGTQLLPASITARHHIYDLLFGDPDFGYRIRNDFWPLRPLNLRGPSSYAFEPEDTQRWEPERWRETYQQLSYRFGLGDRYVDAFVVTVLAFARLEQALRSPDAVTRSLAIAALVADADGNQTPPDAGQPAEGTVPASPTVSTMIHGTRAFLGDWWRPRVGNFHRFISDSYRPNLYSGGAHFHWSGVYSPQHRARAAEYFAEWVADRAPAGIQSVFGHSYGGEIAARALKLGTPIQEPILLSTPVSRHVKAAAQSGTRLVDIRLPFDPVLALELKVQRIPPRPNVTEVLTRWRLDHGATHKEAVWQSDNLAQRAQIEPKPDLARR